MNLKEDYQFFDTYISEYEGKEEGGRRKEEEMRKEKKEKRK